jgi:hypothetical protein
MSDRKGVGGNNDGKPLIQWPEDKNALPDASGEDDLYN